MSDGTTGLREAAWTGDEPWHRIVRAVLLSFDSPALVLATLGLLALRLGWSGLDAILPDASAITPAVPTRLGVGVAGDWRQLARTVADPARIVTSPFLALTRVDSWPGFSHAVLGTLWGVVVWGLFGGAIARRAALKAATLERVGLVEALRFAWRKATVLIGTPLTPWIGLGTLAGCCAAFGLLYRLPGGATVAGVLGFLPLLAGLAMALLIVGLAAGWPLMIVSVAVEAEDGFDALSRSFGYVFQRPGRYAASIALSWVAGVLGLVAVALFAGLVVHLTRWGVSLGMGTTRTLDRLAGGDVTVAGATAASLHRFWNDLVGHLAYGWVFAYFWTAATLIYLALRREVDGTPWHDIALEREDVLIPRPSAAEAVVEPGGPERVAGME